MVILAPTLAVRTGLRTLLTADEHIDVTAEASDLSELETLPPETDILVALAEAAARPDLERMARQADPAPAVLLLSDETVAAQGLVGLPLRAWGLLPLDASEEELLASIYALYQGLMVGAPAFFQLLIGRAIPTASEDFLVEELTEREMEVLDLLAEGLANKQIALELSISEHTVKFHVSSIYTKLGATNRTEAVRIGARLGLIVL
ncbi:MAG: response regulator transcription factor [Anaerolineales bacterium]